MIFRALNLVIFLLAVFLAWPLLIDKEYLSASKHLSGVIVYIFVLSGYVWVIIKKSSGLNRTLFLWIVVCFVVLETAMVIIKNRSPYADDVYRMPTPYMQFIAMPGAKIPANPFMSDLRDPIHINSMGVRVERDMNSKAPGEKRIIMLGGSTVFNGTPLANTIPGRLQQLLGEPYRVYNFGVVSYISAQELDLLIHRIMSLQPDIVITYDGGNDIATPFLYDPRPNHPYNFMIYEQGARILQQRNANDLLTLLLKKSNLLGQLFKRTLDGRILPKEKLRHENDFLSARWEEDIIYHYKNNLQTFCTVAKGAGFRYAAFLQPLQRYKTPKIGFEMKLIEDENFGSYLDRQFSRASAAFSELSGHNDNNDCFFYDISHSLESVNEEIYWDFIHTNNRGNEIIANKIHNRLQTWLQ